MSLDLEALAGAKKALRIGDVYFRNERVTLDDSVTPPFWPECERTQFKMLTRVLHDFEVDGEVEDGDGATKEHRSRFLEIEFVGSVRCLGQAENEASGEERELISMEVSLGLLYEVTEPCAEESIEEFVRMNVPYHAIPYWREHVHGVCTKRRFRPITVPMYVQAIHRNEPAVSTDPSTD